MWSKQNKKTKEMRRQDFEGDEREKDFRERSFSLSLRFTEIGL